MKRLALVLLMAVICSLTSNSSAQVILKDSTISVVPYFSKNDTLVYQFTNIHVTINGSDTIVTENTAAKFRMVCTKASDKKGFTLEYTLLDVQNNQENEELELKDKISNQLAKAYVGMKTNFTVDANGENLAFENPSKTAKELIARTQQAADSLTTLFPVLGKVVSSPVVEFMKELCANPESMMRNFEEVGQLFEWHGDAFDIDKVKETELQADDTYIRPGKLQFVASPDVEEGKEVEDWCDYVFCLISTTYQDAAKAALVNVRDILGVEATVESIREVLGDKMPSGELECEESYQNEYFGDGWPKHLIHRLVSKSESGYDIKHKEIDWQNYSVGNSK